MVAIIFLIITVVVLYYLLKSSRNEERERKELEKRLEDEFIYNPETGAKMTLEEAQRGHYFDEPKEKRVKSKLEIENNFNDENRELEYFRNDLIENEFALIEIYDAILNLIDKTELINEYKKYQIIDAYQSQNSSIIGVIEVTYEDSNGRHSETVFENQLFLILPKNLFDQAKFEGYIFETIGEIIFIKSTKRVTRSQGLELIKLINR